MSKPFYHLYLDLKYYLGSERPLPGQQRRGAIIILGMLALAKRQVVTDRVDTLLRIGLGPFGRVIKDFHALNNNIDSLLQKDLLLARFTCVALQRLNGSAKKIKGMQITPRLRKYQELIM